MTETTTYTSSNPEPPIGTVLTGDNGGGIEWTRKDSTDTGWHPTTCSYPNFPAICQGITWADLTRDDGPLTLVSEPTTTTPTIEPTYTPQVGDRVRVTFEGTVDDNGLTIHVGERLGLRGWKLATSSHGITVERLRPELPTGLGAVVRLEDGKVATRTGAIDGEPWYVSMAGWRTDEQITERLVDVLSPGIDLP